MRNDKQKKSRSAPEETADDRPRWEIDLGWKEPMIDGIRRVSGKVIGVDPQSESASKEAVDNRIRWDIALNWGVSKSKRTRRVSGGIDRIAPPSEAASNKAGDNRIHWDIDLNWEECYWEECSNSETRWVTGQVVRSDPLSGSSSEEAADNRIRWDINLRCKETPGKGLRSVRGSVVPVDAPSGSASEEAKGSRSQWEIDLDWEETSDEGKSRVRGWVVRTDLSSESASKEAGVSRIYWDIDLDWAERPILGPRRVSGRVFRIDPTSESAPEEAADNRIRWDIDLDWGEASSEEPVRVSGKVFRTDPPPESREGGEKKADKTIFFRELESWLKERFGAILGDGAILAKAATLLTTAFIVYFNFLKHRYDVGYYHQYFGVPEEYLEAAWNSAMTDFVLYALISVFQSLCALVLLLFLCVVLFLVWDWIVQFLEQLSETKRFTWRKLWPQVIAVIVSLCLICLGLFLFRLFFGYGKTLLLNIAAILGGFTLFMVGVILWNVCRISKFSDEQEEERRALSWINWGFGIVVLLMIIVYGCSADNLGAYVASKETSLTILSPEEAIHEQLNELDCGQKEEHWAVVYQPGEQYLIMPCTIDESGKKAAIYARYHSIIPKAGVVVERETFEQICIADDTPSHTNDLTHREKIDRFIDNVIDGIDRLLKGSASEPAGTSDPTQNSQPAEQVSTTEPDDGDGRPTEPTEPDGTEPTEPDGTEPTEPDGTVPPEPDETVHSETCITEMNVYYTWNCGCCRCTPGLG